jgi:hypothetical protein
MRDLDIDLCIGAIQGSADALENAFNWEETPIPDEAWGYMRDRMRHGAPMDPQLARIIVAMISESFMEINTGYEALEWRVQNSCMD